jgi:rhodanese-related sulfurtransferase
MGPAEAKALMASADSVLLLDVREPAEWNDDVGHIEGAVLVPMRELGPRVGEFSAWKDRPVIAICRVGVRSHQAARLLAAQGFTRVHNLSGGMVAWRRAGY